MIKISVILFFVVSVIFSTIYTPQAILPTLKQVFNISISETNLLLSGMLFVLMISTPFYAPLSNRWSKKNIMVIATFFLFLSVVISAIASNFYMLLFSRVMQGIFVPGITALMLSYVQEIYPKTHRGFGMGIYMAATSFGAVVGRLLAGWITYIYSWKEAFAAFAILLLVALIAMIFGLPSSEKNSNSIKKKINKENIIKYLSNRYIISILTIPTVVFFSFMAVTTYVTYHLADTPFNFNTSQIGNIFLVLLVGVFVSPVAGRYSDIIGRVKVLFIGVASLIIGILLTLTQSYIFIILGIGFVTAGMFSVQSVTPTYLGDMVPHDRNTVAVLYQTFFYLGGALGTLIPTLAWDFDGYSGVAFFCIILIMIGVIPLIYVNIAKKDNKFEERNI